MRSLRPILLLLLGALAPAPTSGNEVIHALDFVDRPLREVFAVLSDISGVSIYLDETVDGRVSFSVRSREARHALEDLAATYGLQLRREGEAYFVSRIAFDRHEETGLVSVCVDDLPVRQILRFLATRLDRSLVWDTVGEVRMSLNAVEVAAGELLRTILTRLPGFQLIVDDHHYEIRAVGGTGRQPAISAPRVTEQDGLFSVEVETARARDVIAELFSASGNEYAYLLSRDVVVEGLSYTGRDFESLLRTILLQCGGRFVRHDEIYILYDRGAVPPVGGQLSVMRYKPLHRGAAELMAALPSGFRTGQGVSVDSAANLVIVAAEGGRGREVIEQLRHADRPSAARTLVSFPTGHMTPSQAALLLPRNLAELLLPVTDDARTILARATAFESAQIAQIIDAYEEDAVESSLTLNHISFEELMFAVPRYRHLCTASPSDPQRVLFSGPRAAFEALLDSAAALDTPARQLRYQVLVLQIQESAGLDHSLSGGLSPRDVGDQTVFLAELGELINLDFDIVAYFGYEFSVDLNSRISANRARVIADASLTAVSGVPVQLRNTGTFRYRVADDSGEGLAAVRELTSGLVLSITGRLDNAGVVTMDVEVTISKRGEDPSGSADPPATSEKVLSTRVTCPIGRPVAVGGLVQQDYTRRDTGVPILDHVPVLGDLVGRTGESLETTEFSVYIVPSRDRPVSVEARMAAVLASAEGAQR